MRLRQPNRQGQRCPWQCFASGRYGVTGLDSSVGTEEVYMRIGIMIGDETQLLSQPPEASRRPPDLEALVREAQQMETRGFASAWLVNIFEFDAIGTSAILGRET
jgi:hypothetical protein